MSLLPTAFDHDLLHRYLRHLSHERQVSPHTNDAYSRDLGAVVAFALAQGLGTPDSFTDAHIRDFVAESHQGGLSPRSLARRLSAVRGFWRWLQREGLAKGNPALEVRPPKAGRRLPATLDVDRMTRLLTPQVAPAAQPSMAPDPTLATRDLAIMELFYSSGIRLAELVGLNLGDIDFDEQLVRVTGKGRKQRIIPVGGPARRAVLAWLALRQSPYAAGSTIARSCLGQAARAGCERASALVPAFFRHASTGKQSRSARRAGTAGPCKPVHDAGVYPRGLPALGPRIRKRAPACAAQKS